MYPSDCQRAKINVIKNFEVHNEIHNVKKPREALPSQVFQVVAKSIGRANYFDNT